MTETVKTAAEVYHNLGALAFLIVCGALAFAYLVLRIVKTQDKISATLDKVNERQSQHDQRAVDMHATCQDHGIQLHDLRDGLGEVRDGLAGLSTEVKVLKERVG